MEKTTQDIIEILETTEVGERNEVNEDTFISARKVWKYLMGSGKPLYWVSTYKTLLTYMSKYEDILVPTRIGQKTGIRYFVKVKDLANFIKAFEESELN